jgi:predicted secreted protein
VLKMLALRFGPLPAAAERRVKRASAATLERWAERLLTAKSLDDVLAH